MWCHTVMCTHMEQQLLMHPKEKKRKEKKEEKYWQWDLQTVAHVKKHSEIFERIFIPKEKNDHFCIHLVSFKDWGSNDSKSSSIVIESCLWRAAIAAGIMVGLQPYSAKGTFVWKSRLLLPKQTVWIAEWSKAWLKAPQLELPKVRIPVEGTVILLGAAIVQWIRLRPPSCGLGFESQANHLHFFHLLVNGQFWAQIV